MVGPHCTRVVWFARPFACYGQGKLESEFFPLIKPRGHLSGGPDADLGTNDSKLIGPAIAVLLEFSPSPL